MLGLNLFVLKYPDIFSLKSANDAAPITDKIFDINP